jgi:hypothetical protein
VRRKLNKVFISVLDVEPPVRTRVPYTFYLTTSMTDFMCRISNISHTLVCERRSFNLGADVQYLEADHFSD